MSKNRNSAMETSGMQCNYLMPIMFGGAERTATRPSSYQNSKSLKDMSMSEIFKLAEYRAKVAGTYRSTIHNPGHKRMVVSDNITRDQLPEASLRNGQQMGLDTGVDELNDNEKFFDDLMKKMIAERFIPDGEASGLKKRPRFCNKENLNISNKTKPSKARKTNAVSIPSFARRLLPCHNDNKLSAGAKIQLRWEAPEKRQEDQAPSQHKSTSDPIQEDINMKEVNLPSTDHNSSLDTTISINQSYPGNRIADEWVLPWSQETVKLDHSRSVVRIDDNPVNGASSSSYYSRQYTNNFLDTPCLSAIASNRELSRKVEFPAPDNIKMSLDLSLHLTPPLSTEPVSCEACNSYEEENDRVMNNFSRLSSVILIDDSDD